MWVQQNAGFRERTRMQAILFDKFGTKKTGIKDPRY